jgi:hypothetical protein
LEENMELNICSFKEAIENLVIDLLNKNYNKIEIEKNKLIYEYD